MGERGAPVGHVHGVEARLEQLVLEQHADALGQGGVGLLQGGGQAVLAGPGVVLAG